MDSLTLSPETWDKIVVAVIPIAQTALLLFFFARYTISDRTSLFTIFQYYHDKLTSDTTSLIKIQDTLDKILCLLEKKQKRKPDEPEKPA